MLKLEFCFYHVRTCNRLKYQVLEKVTFHLLLSKVKCLRNSIGNGRFLSASFLK